MLSGEDPGHGICGRVDLGSDDFRPTRSERPRWDDARMTLMQTIRTDMVENKRLLDRITVISFRVNQAANRGRLRFPKRIAAKLLDAAWLQLVIGADLPGRAQCGDSLRMPHGGRGVAIHPNAVIGSRATIYHRVTIGGYSSDKMNVPTIGDDVYFGVGCTVLGRVKVGDGTRVGAGAILVGDIEIGTNARIRAGAVVDHDVPARKLVEKP